MQLPRLSLTTLGTCLTILTSLACAPHAGTGVPAPVVELPSLDVEGSGVVPHVQVPSAAAMLEVARVVRHRSPYSGAVLLGDALLAAGSINEAERYYRNARMLAPDSAAPRTGLGLAYMRRPAWDRAFAAWDAILARDPDDYLALYQLGRTSALSNRRLAGGERALRRYLQYTPNPEDPTHAHAYRRLGMIVLGRGDTSGNRRATQEATSLDPKDRESHALLARVTNASS